MINLALISTIFAGAVFGTLFAFITTCILYKNGALEKKTQTKSEFEVTTIKQNGKEIFLSTPTQKKEGDGDKDYISVNNATPRVEKEGPDCATARSE